jgi:tetratricopeptide (TPR) repeat protein
MTRAVAATALGNLYADRGKGESAKEEYNTALAIYSSLAARRGQVIVENDLADLELDASDLADAHSLLERTRQDAINDRDTVGIANTDITEGSYFSVKGDYDQAIDYYSQARAQTTSINDKYLEAASLEDLGDVYRIQGNYNQARSVTTESLKLFAALGAVNGEAVALQSLSDLAG